MPWILDRLPIATEDGVGFVRNEMFVVKAYEIIIWVSLGVRGTASPSGAPRFPAILDPAHTHNFSIQEEHLTRWAGLQLERLHATGAVRHLGRRVPLYAADVWV